MIRDQAHSLRQHFPEASPKDYRPQGRRVRALSFTSGKGGVGKTNIVVNLSVQLAKRGKKVLLIDADLGLANIDIMLNLNPQFTVEDVLLGKKQIHEVMVEGPLGVHILPASSGVSEMTELSGEQQMHMLQQLASLQDNYDFILIDTGAGIASTVLRFNAAADEICVITTTEPTALTDAYALMKVMATKYQVRKFNLIVNQVGNMKEAKAVYEKLKAVFQQFLPVDLMMMGFIPRDVNFPKAVRAQTPLSLLQPNSSTSKAFALMAKHLEQNPGQSMEQEETNFFTRLGLFKRRL